MKILGIGLPQPTVAAVSEQKHLVVPCSASDPEDLFEFADCERPDIIAVDADTQPWLLREVGEIRRLSVSMPVVAIVSPNCLPHWERRAAFLEAGGNDLFESPIQCRELLASMDALHRVYSKSLLGNNISVTRHNVTVCIDLVKRKITVDGEDLNLPLTLYRVLEILLLHKGKVVSVDRIRELIYGYDDVPQSNSFKVYICELRKKLTIANPATSGLIENIWGTGYRINSQ